MKKLIASLALIMSFTLIFSACAKKTEANDKTSSAPVQKSDRTPSALEKAAGTYVSDKFTLILSASDESIADIIVKSPDASNPEGEIWWTMTGEFAQDTGEIKYADCVKSTRVNGDVVEQLAHGLLALQVAEHLAARSGVVLLGAVDDGLGIDAQSLSLGHSGGNLLVKDQRNGHVGKHGVAMTFLTA